MRSFVFAFSKNAPSVQSVFNTGMTRTTENWNIYEFIRRYVIPNCLFSTFTNLALARVHVVQVDFISTFPVETNQVNAPVVRLQYQVHYGRQLMIVWCPKLPNPILLF
jgi:hypothetical protein